MFVAIYRAWHFKALTGVDLIYCESGSPLLGIQPAHLGGQLLFRLQLIESETLPLRIRQLLKINYRSLSAFPKFSRSDFANIDSWAIEVAQDLVLFFVVLLAPNHALLLREVFFANI